MNRRDRRAQGKSAVPGEGPDVRNLFDAALFHHRSGRLPEAERLYRQVLAATPRHADAQHLLGVIARQSGRSDLAVDLIGRAIRIDGGVAFYHSNLGNALRDLGRHREAAAAYRTSIGLAPDVADTHNGLGNALKDMGRAGDALAAYQDAIRLKPDFAEAHSNLGNALKDLGRLEDAIAAYGAALRLRPDLAQIHFNLAVAYKDMGRLDAALAAYDAAIAAAPEYAEAHNNRGNALKELGRLEEAAAAFRTAIVLRPALAEPHNNLGGTLKEIGRLDEAIAAYEAAIRAKPDYAEAYGNLGMALCEASRPREGLTFCVRSLRLKETAQGRAGFVECLARQHPPLVPDEAADLARRALREGWSRPGKLAACIAATAIARLAAGGRLPDDALLVDLMRLAPIGDIALETRLTTARAELLGNAAASARKLAGAELHFACALAEQCFVNEFVFDCSQDELAAAAALRERIERALATGLPVDAGELAALACYEPLHSLADAARLPSLGWPAPVRDMLVLQVVEPLAEREIRAGIASLTAIDADVSAAVRRQYEENPYPRWVRTEPVVPCASIEGHIRIQIPRAPLVPVGNPAPDILIAGCGTGLHPIETAQIFPAAKVLAVDLSVASLGYATRKAKELALPNLEFAQADILRLDGIGRTFDAIESVGVLHHLADPEAGLRILAGLLKPRGFLRLGLYSERARRAIVAVREFIAREGYGTGAADIRRCRQALIALDGSDLRRTVVSWGDFASTSGCRDLLFHVQEHRCTLPEIAGWLDRAGLAFLGFDIGPETRGAFRQAHPEPGAETDLHLWDAFEARNPDIFGDMFQFWVQKAA
jgi:tetratricopeptide (TPR) repeat protein/SAM-dependent methyltransferase